MDSVFNRVVAILTNPQEEWGVIQKEKIAINEMLIRYVLIVAAIPAVSFFLGHSVIGFQGSGVVYRYTLGTCLSFALSMYIFLVVSVFIVAFIIDVLAPYFGAKRNMVSSTKVAVFSHTACWIGGIFYLVPAISFFIFLFDIYALVLLYMGIQRLKHPSKGNMAGYFIITIAAVIVSFFFREMIIHPGLL